jgi:hypothetical protein
VVAMVMCPDPSPRDYVAAGPAQKPKHIAGYTAPPSAATARDYALRQEGSAYSSEKCLIDDGSALRRLS